MCRFFKYFDIRNSIGKGICLRIDNGCFDSLSIHVLLLLDLSKGLYVALEREQVFSDRIFPYKERIVDYVIFPYKERIVDCVITWGKTGRRKSLFWNILHNIGESHAKYILSPKFFYVDLGSLLATESSVCKSWTES